MPYGKELLQDPRIRNLCLASLADRTKLDAALEEIYRTGFAGTPQAEDAPGLFVQRLKAVRAEFRAQLRDCLEDPHRWQLRQPDIAEDPDAMAAGITLLAALANGNPWEQAECRGLLDRRMAAGPAFPEENRALLRLFGETPMTAVFAGGQMPRLPEEKTTQVAGILAMCTYVTIKREPAAGVLPEMSFDAVCIWSNAMTEALCRRDGPAPETVATVSCVMAAQYLHISQWKVLKAALESLYALSYPTMGKVLDNIRLELLTQDDDPCLVEWIWLEERPFRYRCWLELLGRQAGPQTSPVKEDRSENETEDDPLNERSHTPE